MKIEELYPYWNDAHEELLLELERLDEPEWDVQPGGSGPTIRQIVLHMIESERFWIQQIAQGRPAQPVRSGDYPTGESLIEALKATRAATIRYVDMLKYENLRSVRAIPADPKNNIPETNMPLSWVIWRVMEHEIYHWGQIALRVKDIAR